MGSKSMTVFFKKNYGVTGELLLNFELIWIDLYLKKGVRKVCVK